MFVAGGDGFVFLFFICSKESFNLSSPGPGGSDQLHVVHLGSQLAVTLQPQLQVVITLLQAGRSHQPLGLQEHHRKAAGTRKLGERS